MRPRSSQREYRDGQAGERWSRPHQRFDDLLLPCLEGRASAPLADSFAPREVHRMMFERFAT